MYVSQRVESWLGCLSAISNHLELQAVVQESKTKHCLPTRKLFKAAGGWLWGAPEAVRDLTNVRHKACNAVILQMLMDGYGSFTYVCATLSSSRASAAATFHEWELFSASKQAQVCLFRPAAYEYYMAEGEGLKNCLERWVCNYDVITIPPAGSRIVSSCFIACLKDLHIFKANDFVFRRNSPLSPFPARINFRAVVASRTRSIRSAINRENATGRNKYNNRIGKQSVSIFGRKSGFTGPGFRILNPEGRPTGAAS